MKQLLLVFVGGGMGSVVRYGLNKLFAAGTGFPFATLTANILSCLLVGIVVEKMTSGDPDNDLRLLLITGFCGGFSTFSAFALETNNLFGRVQYELALANIILNFALSMLAIFLGGWLARTAL